MSNEAKASAAAFGRAFKKKRLDAGISVVQLAAHYVKRDGAVGCDYSYINAVEAGTYLHMSGKTRRRLNAALGASIREKSYKDGAMNANPLRGQQQPTLPEPPARTDWVARLMVATSVLSFSLMFVLIYILLKGI